MKKNILSVLSILMCGALLVTPVSAISCPEQCSSTAIFGEWYDENGNKVDDSYQGEKIHCACDSGNGDSILDILSLILDIMTVGIGILGVIGITIVGIQYLTAGGSEEKTRKAKRRMFEIVIGLVAYVLIYAILKWLMPGMK